jgi:hypothetical protein
MHAQLSWREGCRKCHACAERAQGGMDMMVYTREVPSPLSTSSRGPQSKAAPRFESEHVRTQTGARPTDKNVT